MILFLKCVFSAVWHLEANSLMFVGFSEAVWLAQVSERITWRNLNPLSPPVQ